MELLFSSSCQQKTNLQHFIFHGEEKKEKKLGKSIICLISIVLWIHVHIFFKLLCRTEAGAEENIDYYVYVCLPATIFSPWCLFLFLAQEKWEFCAFLSAFRSALYLAFNELFYALFCSMSLPDVIYYDFYSKAQISLAEQARPNRE